MPADLDTFEVVKPGGVSHAGTGQPEEGDVIPTRVIKKDDKIPYEVLRLISEESANHYHIVPLSASDGVLEVGMMNPDDLEALDALNFITRKSGMPYKVFRISQKDFDAVIAMYEGLGGEVDQALHELGTEPHATGKVVTMNEGFATDEPLNLDAPIKPTGAKKDGEAIEEDAPAIKLASTILRYAIDGKASDVHIEPTETGVRVRYRVDGILHTSVVLPPSVHRSLVARFKVLSAIRLDEQRKPQDGRFMAEIDGRKIDFRVSTFPSYYGEKVVIRILDREEGFIPLDQLGMPKELLAVVHEALVQPYGLILISGPTGSGKSTTLYSMLGELNRDEKNVLSLEDPVEYNMTGVTQSQVRPEIGYTFANGLRTTLRQDPDIIMVGEIRDGETAKLAIQAALTGHLVLSTIHTNSAIGTIPRLIDMGVEPYLIPPTLILSMAQRLVRQLCPGSAAQVPMSASVRSMLERDLADLPPSKRPALPDTVYEVQRTPECPNGTRGRRAVFEALTMSPDIERVILKRPVESEIYKVARARGMMTMKEDALVKSFAGSVPFSEVTSLGTAIFIEEEEETPAPSSSSPAEPALSGEQAPIARVTEVADLEGEANTSGAAAV